MRLVGVVVRLRHHGDDLAGADVENEAGGGERMEFGARRDELVAQRVLHAQIERERDRRLQPVGGEPRQMQRGQALIVEPLLDAGGALVVDIDVADEMRDLGAVRIVALVFVEEADAGQTLVVDFVLLLRRDVALEPDETPPRRQPVAQFGGVEIGQIGGQKFDRFVDVDQPARFGVERGHAHVGRQDFAAAVENVGARRRDGVAGRTVARGAAVGGHREHDEPDGDDAVDGGEGEDRQTDAGPRLDAAIDRAAVQQAAEEPPAPRLRRLSQ